VSDYDVIRHFADTYGLAAMFVVFTVFALWTFRPSARGYHEDAAVMIFAEDDEENRLSSKDKSHG